MSVLWVLFIFGVYSKHNKVFLFRHCARAPIAHAEPVCGYENYTDYIDYASEPLPDFGVDPAMCTPKGLEFIWGEGKALVSQGYLSDENQIYFVVDNVTRDIDTADSLMEGLYLPVENYMISPEIFAPLDYIPSCQALVPDSETATKEMEEELRTIKPVANDLYADMQQVLGQGDAPSLAEIEDYVKNGKFCGKTNVAEHFAQAFMLELGSGLEVAWNSSDFQNPDDIWRYFELTGFYHNVTCTPTTKRLKHSNLVYHIMNSLNAETHDATVYVGHDTDIMAMAKWFDLRWSDRVYNPYGNIAPPGSALLFELIDDMLQVKFLFIDFQDVNRSLFVEELAMFQRENAYQIPLSTIQENYLQDLEQNCISKD